MFSKEQPVKKDKFWAIGQPPKQLQEALERRKTVYMAAFEKYKKEKDERIRSRTEGKDN